MRLSRGAASAGRTRSSQCSTFLQYILHIPGLLICISQALPSSAPTDNKVESIFNRVPTGSGEERKINIRSYFSYDQRSTKPNGLTSFPWHTALEIGETDADEKLKIEIVDDRGDWVWRIWLNSHQLRNGNERSLLQGTTTLTNDEIVNKYGRDPAWDALVKDPQYRTGPSNSGKMNTCHNLASRLIRNMGIQVTDEVQK